MCVCVSVRERERERGRGVGLNVQYDKGSVKKPLPVIQSLVCCVPMSSFLTNHSINMNSASCREVCIYWPLGVIRPRVSKVEVRD